MSFCGGGSFSRIFFCAATAIFFIAADSADLLAADDLKRGETVANRQRPEWDAQGLLYSGFKFFPEISSSFIVDDNIYSKPDSIKRADRVFEISPKLKVVSNWNNHHLGFMANSDIRRYALTPDENHENHRVRLDGRIDVSRDIRLFADLKGGWLNEKRSSPDEANGISPTQYQKHSLNLRYEQDHNRFGIKLGSKITTLDYDDTLTTSTIVNNDDRDRIELKFTGELTYKTSSEYQAFIRINGYDNKYRDFADDNGVQRDSQGVEPIVGVKLDYTGSLFGDIFVGYRYQHYDDPTLKAVNRPVFGSSLTWTPSGLTTVVGKVENKILETTYTGASGINNTEISLNVDHELLRNLILNSKFSVDRADYVGASRMDYDYKFKAGFKYLLNQKAHVNFNYDFIKRKTNVDGSDFNNNKFTARLIFQI